MTPAHASASLSPQHAALNPLFDPIRIGTVEAPNRVLMAPLTRNRAHEDGTPHEMAIDYYRQRASAGLIISEASQINPMGKGYLDTPGIYTDKHIHAWRKVTDAVHEAGGRIFLQLWHVGRISHTSLLPDQRQPLAPSAIVAKAKTFTQNGFEPVSPPVAMSLAEINSTIKDYGKAAGNAIAAGFDGVEIHGANSYLIDQFIRSSTNQREDEFGGMLDNRLKFALAVTDSVINEIGAERTGIRLSPTGKFGDISDEDPATTFGTLVKALNTRNLAYLHIVEKFGQDMTAATKAILTHIRTQWTGIYIANGDYTAEQGAQVIADGHAHAVAYGRAFIANPDLPYRFAHGVEPIPHNQATLYGGGKEGYTDYPFFKAS